MKRTVFTVFTSRCPFGSLWKVSSPVSGVLWHSIDIRNEVSHFGPDASHAREVPTMSSIDRQPKADRTRVSVCNYIVHT